VSAELLFDNSAWARLGDPHLPQSRREEIASALEEGRVAVSFPFLLEAGYSARSAGDHDSLLEELLSLPFVRVDDRVEARAVDAQRQLARAGHHRLPPVDLILAAIAERHGLAVLHYDADFDVLGAKTDLSFESTWLLPRGTI
jgi:predicted nucleic acid-binding protein